MLEKKGGIHNNAKMQSSWAQRHPRVESFPGVIFMKHDGGENQKE